MAGRCGCAGTCSCLISNTGVGINVTGSGTSSSPWVINVTGPADCTAVADCMATHIGPGLSYNAGSHVLGVRYSTDSGNTIGPGSDGGLFVPPAGSPGSMAILVGSTPEINAVGDGSQANPLQVALTGNRYGNFAVHGGDCIVGDTTDTVERDVRIRRFVNGAAVEARLNIQQGYVFNVDTTLNGAEYAGMHLSTVGVFYTESGNILRPHPFAQQVGEWPLDFTNDASRYVTVNFIAGRFTYRPMVTATVNGASSYYAYTGTATTASVGIAATHRDGTLVTGTVSVQWHATQMLSTGAPGRAGRDAPTQFNDLPGITVMDVTTVCHTVGCPNAELPITSRVYPWDGQPEPDVMCSGCWQPVTDIDMPVRRR